MESGDVAGWEAGAFTRLNVLPLTAAKSGRSFRRTQQGGLDHGEAQGHEGGTGGH